MVILRTRNKITDFLMILAWASPFKTVLMTPNTNMETNAAIHSSQFDSVGRNGQLLAAPPTVNTPYK